MNGAEKKGIDYSKWDKMTFDTEEGESVDPRYEEEDGEGEYDEEEEEEEIREVLRKRLASEEAALLQRKQQSSDSQKPKVTKLGQGGNVTIGPQGVTYGSMPPATSSPFGNKKSNTQWKEQSQSQSPSGGPSSVEEVGSSGDDEEESRSLLPPPSVEDEVWWKKHTHNGTWSAEHRYGLSQTKTHVQILLLLQHMDASLSGGISEKDGRLKEPPKCCVLSAKSISSVTVKGEGKCLQIQLSGKGGSDVLAPLQFVGPWAKSAPEKDGAATGGGRQSALAGRVFDFPLQHPLQDSEEVLEGCWELLTVRALHGLYKPPRSSSTAVDADSTPTASTQPGWFRLLSLSVPKEEVGQGTYLWWDRVFAEPYESEPSLDVTEDIEGRDVAKAKALKMVWQDAEAKFNEKNKK